MFSDRIELLIVLAKIGLLTGMAAGMALLAASIFSARVKSLTPFQKFKLLFHFGLKNVECAASELKNLKRFMFAFYLFLGLSVIRIALAAFAFAIID